MITIILDVSEALAGRLASHREQLSQLLARASELSPGELLLSFSAPPTRQVPQRRRATHPCTTTKLPVA